MHYYTLTLTALSPVHIGSGTEISKKDCLYMSDRRKVYILDSIKIFESMKRNNLLRDYEKYLMDGSQKNFTEFVRRYCITPAEYMSWARYELPLDDISVNSSRSAGGGSDNIAAFMKDPYGCPYIPGSSLKGALRSAIQGAFIAQRRSRFKDIADGIPRAEFRGRTRYLSQENNRIAKELFYTLGADEKHSSSAVNDIFRGLRVSDSKPLAVSDLILCQKIDRKPNGEQITMPARRECLRPGTEITFDIEIDGSFMELGADDIYSALDSFYDIYRRNFLGAFDSSGLADNKAAHCLLIGGGVGFASKTTVYPLYADREGAVRSVQAIMEKTTPRKHGHFKDGTVYCVSPHIRKCTKYKRVLYDMGICGVDISEKG